MLQNLRFNSVEIHPDEWRLNTFRTQLQGTKLVNPTTYSCPSNMLADSRFVPVQEDRAKLLGMLDEFFVGEPTGLMVQLNDTGVSLSGDGYAHDGKRYVAMASAILARN